MSQKVTGQVFRIYEKQFPGKPMTYSVKLEDNPIYYRLGIKRGAGIFEPGNLVEFMATPNADGKSANVDGGVAKIEAPAAGASGTPALGNPNDGRQNSIVYQSSLKAAVALTTFLYDKGIIVLPKKQSDQLGNVEATLDRLTAQFFNDVNTLGAVVREAESEGAPAGEAKTEEEGE